MTIPDVTDMVDLQPLPLWSDRQLHGQAHGAARWIHTTMKACGLGEPVFARRVELPREMRKLIERLQTEGRMRRIDEPGIIWTCLHRLDPEMGHMDRMLWLSALTRAYYLIRNQAQDDGS